MDDEPIKHRLSRYLRVALCWGLTLQGIFAPWNAPPAYAVSNPDCVTIGVLPVSTQPPDAIADLLASANFVVPGQISLSWTAPQGNAGGSPIPNQTVENYIVRYATFSVDSLAGNTTSWWNAAAVNSTTLQPPSYTPQVPGQWEAFSFTGLTIGVTYYFAVKSTSQGGVLSPVDSKAGTPGQQAHATSIVTIPPPATFTGAALSNTSIQWSWSLVPGATTYFVYSDPANVLLQTLNDPTTSWTETGLAINTAYSRKALSADALAVSSDSVVATRYTLAVIPGTPTVSGVTNTSVSLGWTSANPAGTGQGVERSPDGVTFTQIALVTGTTIQDTGLAANTSYYYRIRAFNGDGIASGYTAVVSALTAAAPAGAPPMQPNGLTSQLAGAQFTLGWHAVKLDISSQPIAIDHYEIDRYDVIDSSPTVTVNVPASATTYTENVASQVYFYRITAVAASGTMSTPSDYMDSSAQAYRYTLAPDDHSTRVLVPGSISRELNSEYNGLGQDLELRLTRRSQDEIDVTLRSYDVGAYKILTGDKVFTFTFSQSTVLVQLGYGAIIGSGHLPPAQVVALQNVARTNAGSIAQIVSVYWFNGASYIRVTDPVLTAGQALSVSVRNLGIYQIRAVQISSTFQLTQGSPYPRVITPNDPTQNNRVFFFFENPSDDPVTGSIYDIRGAKVRDLTVNSQSPTANSLVWDGRDSRGAVVRSGVYLYKITAGKESQTGTVVVAR